MESHWPYCANRIQCEEKYAMWVPRRRERRESLSFTCDVNAHYSMQRTLALRNGKTRRHRSWCRQNGEIVSRRFYTAGFERVIFGTWLVTSFLFRVPSLKRGVMWHLWLNVIPLRVRNGYIDAESASHLLPRQLSEHCINRLSFAILVLKR